LVVVDAKFFVKDDGNCTDEDVGNAFSKVEGRVFILTNRRGFHKSLSNPVAKFIRVLPNLDFPA
jgi:hypothetical protein